MSSKINICCVISEHYDSLRDPESGKYSVPDMITFIVIPLLFAALAFYSNIKLTNELVGLLVNFGSIITALLLSVLVLVYDQRNKIDDKVLLDKSSNTLLLLKQTVLSQLFSNICYATIISVSLVATCFLEQMVRPTTPDALTPPFVGIIHGWVLSPLVFFLITHVMLTLLMIIKRMHTLLTAK